MGEYVVLVNRRGNSWDSPHAPIARPLEKITAKCVFFGSGRWCNQRVLKSAVFYRVFPDKETAEAFAEDLRYQSGFKDLEAAKEVWLLREERYSDYVKTKMHSHF